MLHKRGDKSWNEARIAFFQDCRKPNLNVAKITVVPLLLLHFHSPRNAKCYARKSLSERYCKSFSLVCSIIESYRFCERPGFKWSTRNYVQNRHPRLASFPFLAITHESLVEFSLLHSLKLTASIVVFNDWKVGMFLPPIHTVHSRGHQSKPHGRTWKDKSQDTGSREWRV